VFRAFRDNDKPKKVLVVSGGQVMANVFCRSWSGGSM
jgi:hypothetical protein